MSTVPGSATATPMLTVTGTPTGRRSRTATRSRSAISSASSWPAPGRIDEDLLAADPVDRVAGAQRRPHRVGDVLEDGVAGGVAELVVDPLEVVEVAEQQGVGEALARGCRAGRRARPAAAPARCG